MEILINDYQPKLINGQHLHVEIAGKKYLPYVINYTVNGQAYTGEGKVMKAPPKWKPGEKWDVTITQDATCAGGFRITNFNNPYHTGGSSFSSGGNQSYAGSPQYNQPQSTGAPQFSTPAPTAVPQYPTESTTATSNPKFSKDTKTEALIIAQSSMKVACEYITHISEIERNALIMSLKEEGINAETDTISKYALKIARETVIIAKDILPSL